MEYKTSIKHLTCYGSNDGAIKLYIAKNIGKIYINWINLPKESIISNNGKYVYNLPAGVYLVELEDKKYFGNTKKTISIEIQQPDALKIDFIQIKQPICYDSTGSMDIFVSGGVSPYFLYFDKYTIKSTTNKITINNISNNIKSKIILKDKNNCIFETNEYITIHKPRPSIDIDIKQPTLYGEQNAKAIAHIKNIDNPKIGWYKLPDIERPIAMNTLKIENQFAGDYRIKCIDENDCSITKDFTITQPRPTNIEYITTPDYTTNTKYNPKKIKSKFNTLLIPYQDETYAELLKIIPGDVIRLKNKDQINKYNIIMQPDIVDIDGLIYYRLYILPLIEPNILSKTTTLLFNNKEYKVYYGFKNKYQCYICLTSLILDASYKYAFNINDICELSIGDNTDLCSIININQQYNLYEYSVNNTVLYPRLSKDLLTKLNADLGLNDLSIRSTTTTSVQKKGSIFLSINVPNDILEGVYNIEANTYKYKIVCYNTDKSYYNTFYTNNEIMISDLAAGDYTILIDKYMMNFLNGNVLNDYLFTFSIKNQNPNKPMIGDHINLLKFKKPSSNTGLFINIAPYNQDFTLVHENESQNYSSSYQVLNNLKPGKYTIIMGDLTKDIFITKNQFTQINSLT